MKKWICGILTVCLALPAFTAARAIEAPPEISARSAALINADTLEVLYEKNAHEALAMASTTKIMTGLLGLEYAELHEDPLFTVTREAVCVEGSSMGLSAGWVLPVSELVKGMMASSGNDAANCIALAVSGNVPDFVGLMNARAAELGMRETHFETPSGLDGETHYSTAYDMALLGAAAMENALLSSIVSQKTVTATLTSPEKSFQLSNHNRLLSLYEACAGIKTGFTKKAGRCLVSYAQKDGVRLIAVTLNAPDDWNDHIRLFEYGFSVTEITAVREERFTVPAVGGEKEKVLLSVKEINLPLKSGTLSEIESITCVPFFLYAPMEKGKRVGTRKYYLHGKLIGEAEIVTAEYLAGSLPREKGFFEKIGAFL